MVVYNELTAKPLLANLDNWHFKDGGIEKVLVGIGQHLHRHVDVGHFFFITQPLGTTGKALPRFFQEMSPMNVQARLTSQCLKVGRLSLNIG